MKRLKALFVAIATIFSLIITPAYAQKGNKVIIYGSYKTELNNACMVNGSFMVPMRSLSDALGMEIVWISNQQTAIMWNDDVEIKAQINNPEALINQETKELSQAPLIINGYTYMPLRNIAEATNAEVIWNEEGKYAEVYLESYKKNKPISAKDYLGIKDEEKDKDIEEQKVNNTKEDKKEQEEEIIEETPKKLQDSEKVFFFQRQSDWGFENNGSGYCWVCSYAMALTNATKTIITPTMVAKVNEQKGSGAYMQHGDVIKEFGVNFTKAISEDSEYFESYDAWRGATYIKAEDDADAIMAIKEALDKNPQGVMIRYTIYPHTLYAVGYDEDNIYFNEPAYEYGEGVTFDKTCLKNYKVSDLEYIQAIESQA